MMRAELLQELGAYKRTIKAMFAHINYLRECADYVESCIDELEMRLNVDSGKDIISTIEEKE